MEPPFEPAAAAQLARMMPPGEPPIALFRVFARNLAMTEAMHGWGGYELSRRLSLSVRDREIVIDRTCARCGCDYEWGVHVARFAGRAGLTAAQLASLATGSAADECWPDERDRLLILAVDALHDQADIDDDLWRRLTGTFSDVSVLDLLLLCGWYHAISFAARATRLPAERDGPALGPGVGARAG
jgi:alkylhydroperoxidase family enzyme